MAKGVVIACVAPIGDAIGVVEAADRVSGEVDALLLLLLLVSLRGTRVTFPMSEDETNEEDEEE